MEPFPNRNISAAHHDTFGEPGVASALALRAPNCDNMNPLSPLEAKSERFEDYYRSFEAGRCSSPDGSHVIWRKLHHHEHGQGRTEVGG
jgi:hypothetical protein